MESVNILLAYSLDLTLGDPRWFPHPVKMIGGLVNFLEGFLRKGRKEILRVKGACLALTVVFFSTFSAYLILTLMRKLNPIAGTITWIFLAYTTLAAKDLFLHAKRILKEISDKDIVKARKALSCMVGRDTQHLTENDIIKATIESVAESTNDGIIAPLFYLIIGGPVLAFFYKAINTMDSMIGHKDERYRDFGWFAARLDDVANLIPARITGILISVSSFLTGRGFGHSFRTMLQDGRKHPSPNSGISEAAIAGALGIRLGGPSTYNGEMEDKPYLGKDVAPIKPLLLSEALKMSFMTSLLMVLIGAALRCVL